MEPTSKAPVVPFAKGEQGTIDLLQSAKFEHGVAGHSPWLTQTQVELSTDYREGSGDEQKHKSETLTITITDPHVRTSSQALTEFVVKQLQSVPVIKDKIKFGPEGDQKDAMKSQLDKLIKAGAEIPSDYLDAPMFSKNQDGMIALGIEHTVNVNKDDSGLHINIRVPRNAKANINEVMDDLNKRMPQIKEYMATQPEIGGKAGGDAALKQQIDRLDFSVTHDDTEFFSNITIDIRSPEQLAQIRTPGGVAGADAGLLDKLRKSNFLMAVSDTKENPLLQRAIASSYFKAGTPSDRIVSTVSGVQDMKKYFKEKLDALVAKKPELKADADAFLGNDSFKAQDFFKPESEREVATKGEYRARTFSVETEKDQDKKHKLEVKLELPPGVKAQDVVNELATYERPKQQDLSKVHYAQEAKQYLESKYPVKVNHLSVTSKPDLQFAKVDSVQAVAVSSESVMKKLDALLNQVGGPQQAPQAPEGDINQYAQVVVQKVEEAHNALQQGIQIAANQAKMGATWVQRHSDQPTPGQRSIP